MAYKRRSRDWSSDVCASDLADPIGHPIDQPPGFDIEGFGGGRRRDQPGRECGQSEALNVSHWRGSPVSRPRRSQVMRCALVPWVKLSGTGRWPAERISVSSPIALAAVISSSMSPGSPTGDRKTAV